MNSSDSIDWDSLPIDLFNNEYLEPAFMGYLQADLNQASDAELLDLNSSELETMLTNHGQFPVLDQMDISEYLNHEILQEPSIDPQQQQSDLTMDSENHPEIANQQQKNDDNSNILIISVPMAMQDSSTFNSLPNIELDKKTINKINKVASGHAGAFITPSNEQKYRPNIIRRPPLQVMQSLTQKLDQPVLQVIRRSKRKQHFHLNRDDSLLFIGDSPEEAKTAPKSAVPPPSQDAFNDAIINDSEAVEIVHTEIDLNRCPGCKKVFKKLSSHKCKKPLLPKSSTVKAVTTLKLECNVCSETFAHRVDFYEHTKSHNMLFCACCKTSFPNLEELLLHLVKCGVAPIAVKRLVFKSPVGKAEKIVEKEALEFVADIVSVPVIEPKKRYDRAVKTKVLQTEAKRVAKPKKEIVVKEEPLFLMNVEKESLRGKRAAKDVEKPDTKKAKRQKIGETSELNITSSLKCKTRIVPKKEAPQRATHGTRSITKK